MIIPKYIEYSELLKNNCSFAPESDFVYARINEKPIATLNVITCIGIYLMQNDMQVLAHIYEKSKTKLHEILDFLYNEKVITNERFNKAYIIKSKMTDNLNFDESLEYLECFTDKVHVIGKDEYPIHFAFDKKGEFYWINNVKEKQD